MIEEEEVDETLEKYVPLYAVIFRAHWFYLFHALIFLLILYPYLETGRDESVSGYFILLNSLVVITIVYTVSYQVYQFVIGVALAIPVLALNWFALMDDYTIAFCIFNILLYLFAILMIIKHLFSREEVDIENIFGTVSLYLLIGLGWANLYQLIELIYPNSFSLDLHTGAYPVINWSEFIYFSFTTLTTLGYGDIVPINDYSRSIAILESVTGVIFLAVLVARTIGLNVTHQFYKNLPKKGS